MSHREDIPLEIRRCPVSTSYTQTNIDIVDTTNLATVTELDKAGHAKVRVVKEVDRGMYRTGITIKAILM